MMLVRAHQDNPLKKAFVNHERQSLHVKIFDQKISSVCAPSTKRWGTPRKAFSPR